MLFAPEKLKKLLEADMGRRRFLKIGAVAAAAGLLPFPVVQAHCFSPTRSLSLYSPNTGESFKGVYFAEGKYLPDALDKIDHVMRDIRTGDIHLIDPNLLDILFAISQKAHTTSPLNIISGYRCPATNAWLRKRSKRVSRKSMHLFGQAADLRVAGVRTASLKQVAVSIKGGGVGYYPRLRFVHVDTGPIRYW
ncbi:MAG TPA: DUF882 domain-containing protein [Deltaproteobacteria bacterium]|nr:DUF882 domain-containing protein [Deltaproteobacteria bacterium]